ncbi:hypothetical protein [Cyanobium sp. Aljojuca 7A6]|nr:hypothetical protein [Cyanobium sp. Aljojuca 7A6]MCP9834846.1 hypothetical protein [Cyanobium sp. La Preciosa 7G6]MCP9937530.1 hypothetical protein [Cyanobium sp. Aljojuca 7A6]
MPILRGLVRLTAVLLMAAPIATHAAGGLPASPVRLKFADQTYLLRWSSKHQHEFTPSGQDDLSRWTDMITINTYPDVRDGDGLADVANRVLGTYKQNNAVVVRTSSVPRTPARPARPAEHLIVVLFPVRDSIEAVFARLRLTDGRGTAVIYSHRLYGQKAGDAMAAWLKANGPAVERRLMDLQEIPSHRILEPSSP